MPEEQNGKKTTIFREMTERFWLLQLVSEVREDGIYVRLEPLQRSFQRIRPEAIRDVTVTTYAATAYAGWHWGVRKTPGGNTVYRLRGNRGVEIELENGRRWFIGSQHPKAFASAIKRIATDIGGHRNPD